MQPIHKAIKNSLILALILTFCLPVGGALLGVGLGIGQPGIWAVGIGFMALGAVRGEVTTVWRKAATVCLECIGLG